MLGAVDVAFTEAVVGVSISTTFVMMLARRVRTMRLLPDEPKLPKLQAAMAAAVAMGVGLVFLVGVQGLPPFAASDSVMQNHVAGTYIENCLKDMHTPNVVTAILADYRGFDTLIETAVIFTAALACLLVLGGMPLSKAGSHIMHHVFDSVILRTLMTPILAATQLYAVYVVLHGHYSPGGGFQGGVLLAASFIMPLLVDNPIRPYPHLTKRGAIALGAIGVLIYAAFAAAPLLRDGMVLDYAALGLGGGDAAQQRSLGILGIEIGVMLAVAGAMVSIFYSLRVEKVTET